MENQKICTPIKGRIVIAQIIFQILQYPFYPQEVVHADAPENQKYIFVVVMEQLKFIYYQTKVIFYNLIMIYLSYIIIIESLNMVTLRLSSFNE